MSIRTRVYHFLNGLALLGLLLAPIQPLMQPLATPARAQAASNEPTTGLFRTRVTVRTPADWARLEKMGVVVLETTADGRPPTAAHSSAAVGGPWSAVVLADEDRLEALARLRFAPQGTDELGALVAAHAQAKPWLATSLRPLLSQAAALRAEVQRSKGAAETVSPELAVAQASLRTAVRALTPEQQAGLAALTSVDDDADGLTNTEEQWWCTDPLNPNSDGDAQGYTDGQEVDALLNFTLPRSVRWGYGPPFGPPNAWPDWNGQDGNPSTPACNDGDHDTLPDYAEVFMVGSRVPEESTDHDKFDDGQELFGVTYCPGAPTNCGYGSYPAVEYWNYIKASMPSWVLPPGDNLFVAAFPVPEVSVVAGSWTVERVTTITTSQGQMAETTHSYETSVTRGESTSIANTVTWNNWEEVSQAVETPLGRQAQQRVDSLSASPASAAANPGKLVYGGSKLVGGVLKIGGACSLGASIGAGFLGIGAVPGGIIGCLAGVVGSYADFKDGFSAIGDGLKADDVQNEHGTNQYNITNVNNVSASANAQASAVVNNNIDFQGVVNSLDGMQYAINRQGDLLARGLYDISYAISQPRFTETRTSGRSWGGAQTTTHEVYEEHTISEGQAFTTGENWSTAWAVDSSHAADLTFTYTISNTGTEYARELTGVIFNVYLGDDKTPIISYPAWQQFPNGKLENLFPGNAHTFASTDVPLSLEQMKRIDLGERLTVVLEDFSYGADELFYQDAVNGGVTVFIEDGVDDGDELVDSYVIPTWGTESVQDVLTRYFPAGYDLDGNLNALWTPEFDGINPPTWHEHFLSDIAWWNVYLTQADAGNTPLKDLPAVAGSALLFRFNRDSDRDGYNDRVEMRYGTDKNDPASHPYPEVLAGYVAGRSGNTVTVKLVLENSGTFDAYGIDAVMYRPDNTTTIGNNTVGGNGRVRPGAHVAVGSLVKPPDLTNWGSSTAKPYAGGNYSGSADRTYTFNVTTSGIVGQGSTAMSWSDGAGGSGPLALGSSYHAPLPLDVAQGLQVGLNTGTIAAGARFTVEALTPRDTFTYTINSEPFTPPVIVVSFSDPQGSHRFVTPVELPGLDSDLAPHSGQMLKGLALEIQTTGPVTTTSPNTTNFVFNSPHPAAIQDAHLYLDFVSNGTVVAHLPYTLTLQPGPTVYPVTWSTSAFTQTYDPDADNILIAFWTDAQGNIIDSAARPLSTFAEDPKPAFAMPAADATWNFGTVTQGEILNHTFTFANTGFLDLFTYLTSPSGMTVNGATSRRLSPGDATNYAITLDTRTLPVGAYDRTLTIRTSDPANPTRTVHVTGNIQAVTDQAQVFAESRYRPWDQKVFIPGSHNLNEVITFTHSITPEAQLVEPLYVHREDGVLLGVGKAIAFLGDTGWIDLLVFNSGFEEGSLLGWTVRSGGWEVTNYVPHSGTYDARKPGGPHPGYIYRDLSLSTWRSLIDEGLGEAVIGLYSRTDRANGGSMIILRFRQGNRDLAVYERGCTTHVNVWAEDWEQRPIPPGTDNIRAEFGTCDEATLIDDTYVRVRFRYSLHPASSGAVSSTTQPPPMPGVAAPVEHSANLSYLIAGYVTGPAGGGSGIPGIRVDVEGVGWSGTDQDGRYYVWVSGAGRYKVIPNDSRYDIGPVCKWVDVPPSHEDVNFVAMPATPQAGLTLYRDANYAGIHEPYRGDNPDLNNACIGARTVSSLKIGGNYIAVLYREPNYQGTSETFTGDDADLSNNIIGNDTVSSIRVIGYIIEKISGNDYGVRLTLPTATLGGERYWVQYGQRGVYPTAGDHVFHARLPKGRYANATLDLILARADSSPVNVCLDVGNHGACDWTYTGSPTFPFTTTTTNLATPLNTYLASATPDPDGTVVVPIRVNLNTGGELFLTNLVATPGANVDLALSTGDISFGAPGAESTGLREQSQPGLAEPARFTGLGSLSPTALASGTPTEGDTLPITATLHNAGPLDAPPLTVSFYATPTVGSGVLIGTAFVPSVPSGSSAPSSIRWNTLGFTGTVPVRVIADPYNRVAETNEGNNAAVASVNIRTRPDLRIPAIALSDDEPVAGEAVTVTLTLRNAGQTTAGTQTVALYQGNPDAGGTLVGDHRGSPLPGGTDTAVVFTWTPMAPGPYRLFARADRDRQVNEFDEGNNDAWRDVYVGFRGPINLDSGNVSADLAYTPTLGYGVVDVGLADILGYCGSEPYRTYRQDPGGQVVYRFDHLLPGHFYHLDLNLYECDGAGRQETIAVDGNLIAGPVNLGDGQQHRLSLLLDPALYADRAISVTVEAPGIDGAVVSEIALADIDYRYADSGGANDPAYTAARGYGYLDGTPNTAWGTLPFKSVRVDLTNNELRYQFDRLDLTRYYQINFTFWQPSGTGRQQKIQFDGADTGVTVNTGDYLVHNLSVDIPQTAYQDDGSVVVGIVRIGATTGAFVNEIALEEKTSGVTPGRGTKVTFHPAGQNVGLGFTTTVDVRVEEVTDLYGYEVHLTFDPTKVRVDGPVQPGDFFQGKSTQVYQNVVNNTTGSVDYAVTLQGEPAGVSGSGTLFRLVLRGLAEGTSPLNFLASTALSNKAGQAIARSRQNGSLTVFNGGQMTGQAMLQGRTDSSGITVTLGAVGFTRTDPAGSYRLTGIPAATYSLNLAHPGYLYAQRDVTATPGMTVTLPGVILLGGDANGDGCINIFDAVVVSRDFGLTVPPADRRADLTGDGRVNILDGALVGRNFSRCAPSPWPATAGLAAESLTTEAPGQVAATSPSTRVLIAPSWRQVVLGATGDITVAVADVTDLYGYEVHLTFDPARVQVVGDVQPASLFQGKSTLELQKVTSNTAGTVDYAITLQGEPAGVSGSGSLLRLTFRGVTAGPTFLAFRPETSLVNSNIQAIPFSPRRGALIATPCLQWGDIEGNGQVEGTDVQGIGWGWRLPDDDPGWDPRSDVDRNGTVDVSDVQRAASRWGQVCAGGP